VEFDSFFAGSGNDENTERFDQFGEREGRELSKKFPF